MTYGHATTSYPVPARGNRSGAAMILRRSPASTLLLMLPLVGLFSRVATGQLFEDAPQVIEAEQALTEQQDDHIEATALFAHGRVLLQRGLTLEGAARKEQFAMALRRFQRAWRFDPQMVSILEDIAPLTFELERQSEATRYLILAAETQEVPVELLERIAAELANVDAFDAAQNERARRLYQKLVKVQGDSVSVLTRFQIGRLALAGGQFQAAADAFAAVQQAIDRNDPSELPPGVRAQLLQRPEATYALFGESYLRAQRWDEAEAAFRRANDAKPDAATLAFRLALLERGRGHSARALTWLREYFESHSQAAGLAPYVLLAELIDGAGPKRDEPADSGGEQTDQEVVSGGDDASEQVPSDELLQQLKQLAKADSTNALLGYFLADALRRGGRLDQAESLYRKWLEQKPAADAHQGLADIYRQQRRVAPLLKQLAAVVLKTGSLESLGQLVNQIAEDNELLKQLREQTRQGESREGSSRPDGAPLALALLHAAAAQPKRAIDYLGQGLQDPIPTAGQAAVNVAFAMFQMDEAQRAAQVFQQILDRKLLSDRAAEIYFYLAGAWSLARDFDKALAAAREAGRRDPNSPRMLSREPWVLFQAERLEEARDKYIEILDRFDADYASPENRELMRDIRLALSAVEVELGEIESAEQWLQQTLDEFPEDIGAHNDLGYLWADQGKHLKRSLRMIRKAVDAEPDNIAYLDSLGWVLYRLGRFEEALEPLEKAAAGEQVDGVILDHLGDVYLKTNQPAKAVDTWRRAAKTLEQRDDQDLLEKIQEKIQRHAGP